MRLIRCSRPVGDSKEIQLELCEQHHIGNEAYAILSHKWGHPDDEITFNDLSQRDNESWRQKKGYHKLKGCCNQALQDGFTYVWIDTCCINKDSSAELSEAINSMYKWYRRAKICYAYLQDVNGGQENYCLPDSAFRSSQWFTRSWTLQEMIAPHDVRFFAADWTEIGRKLDERLADTLSEITKVPKSVLLSHRGAFERMCVAQKMYWAAGRRTTRLEDRAYSLLGLFDINMPVIYGEGDRAFVRLQEEILRVYFDHTIFVWQTKRPCTGLLAPSADAFALSGSIRKMPLEYYHKYFTFQTTGLDYTVKNLGLEITLPLARVCDYIHLYCAFLACYVEGGDKPIYLLLRRHPTGLSNHFFRTRTSSESFGVASGLKRDNLVFRQFKKDVLLIAEPEEAWERAVRTLPPDHLLDIDPSDPENIRCYVITIGVVGRLPEKAPHVIAVYPMPHFMGRNIHQEAKCAIETEEKVVWIATILICDGVEVRVLVTILDHELVCHIEADGCSPHNIFSATDAMPSCEEFYDRCRLIAEPPCTVLRVRKERNPARSIVNTKPHVASGLVAAKKDSDRDDDDDDDDHRIVIEVITSSTYHKTKPRKDFHVRLRITTEKNEGQERATATEGTAANDGSSEKQAESLSRVADEHKKSSLKTLLARCYDVRDHLRLDDYAGDYAGSSGVRTLVAPSGRDNVWF